MKDFEKIKLILSNNKADLNKKYFVSNLGLFGSYVRGDQSENSDIDALVEFSKPIGLFHFLRLQEYLEEILGEKVDLVSKNALKKRIAEHILREVIYI